MANIEIPNVRQESTVLLHVALKDNGVAVDWEGLEIVRAFFYSDLQRVLAGKCEVAVGGEDSTILDVIYPATQPQYLGVNSLVIRAKYHGREKTYDVPVVNFVERTAQADGVTTMEDPELNVEIEVSEVSTSLLDGAIAAALDAAEKAEEAASLVPFEVLEEAREATQEARQATENAETATAAANEAAEAANAAGITSVQASVADNEPGTPSVDVSLLNKVLSLVFHHLKGLKGDTGATPNITVGTVGTGAPGTPVVITMTGTAAAPVLNITIPQGLKGDKGDQGNTGSSVEYPYELVNNLTTDDATKGLSAAQGVALKAELSQLDQKVGENESAIELSEKIVTKSITDYKFVGGSTLADNNYYAVIHTNTQPNRDKDGVLKYIAVTVAPVSDTPFSIKLYRKVWENGVITGFTEVQNGTYSLTFPAGKTVFDVSSENIVIERDVIIAVSKLAQYKSATSHDNYVVINGAYSSTYQGKFTLNIDYIVQFDTPVSAAIKGVDEDNAGVFDVLGIRKSARQESIIDYVRGGSGALSYGDYWACLKSNALADRANAGVLKKITLLTAPSTDISLSIKLYKKVWENDVITGFTEVEDGVYSFVFPAGETEYDISGQGIIIDKDVVIGIQGPVKYVSTTTYKNYCVLNGSFYSTFYNKFSLEVDYIIEYQSFDSQRLDDIEDAIGTGSLNANIVLLGDSITWMGGDDCNGRSGYEGRGWSQYFKQLLNPSSIRSYARSGATWSHTENTVYNIVEDTGVTSDDNVIYNQINRLLADTGKPSPDIIIIAAGTNDAWYPSARPDAVSVNAATEFADAESYITGEDVGTLTSIAAAMRYDVELLKTNYPNAQIIVTTPLQSTKFSITKCFQVGQIISECAGYLSVSYIDQGKAGGIYRAQEKEGLLFTEDGAHPSVIGAKMVGQFIAKMVMGLYRGELS